jgi:DNA-binding Xre family transcriptional regulator
MEKFIEFIQESIKTIENMEMSDQDKAIVASRLDSICSLLQITLFHLKQNQNEKS